MEDKLIKYHHRAVFYYFKKIGISFSIFLGAFVAVAIPVSIAAAVNATAVANEEEVKTDSETEKQNLIKLEKF
ncbi:MAG: hypothetical protein J6X03_05375 [Bacilli bacterium]|nr:hypothetical protein [Bacilli bacterium]